MQNFLEDRINITKNLVCFFDTCLYKTCFHSIYKYFEETYHGVSENGSKYRVNIVQDNHNITLGLYNDAKSAGRAYDVFVKQNGLDLPLNNLVSFNYFVNK